MSAKAETKQLPKGFNRQVNDKSMVHGILCQHLVPVACGKVNGTKMYHNNMQGKLMYSLCSKW